MANMPFDELFQDEIHDLMFMVGSPSHAVVLGRIVVAMQKYQVALRKARVAGNVDVLREIALVTRFLKYEASDRVSIKFEYLVVEAFETLCGSDAVGELLDYQRGFIAEHQGAEWAAVPDCHKLELEYEEAGLCQVPSWGVESGRANIFQQTRLRLGRHHRFRLAREMNRAYLSGDRHLGLRLNMRYQVARKLIGPLANIECKSNALTMIKTMHGVLASQRVLTWVKANSLLSEYEGLRTSIQAYSFTTPEAAGKLGGTAKRNSYFPV